MNKTGYRRGGNKTRRNKISKNKLEKWFKTCVPPTHIAIGSYEQEICAAFDNFRDERFVTTCSELNTNGMNGKITLCEHKVGKYVAYTIEKSSARVTADNGLYEYVIGTRFINKLTKIFPCFVETFAFFHKSKDGIITYPYEELNNMEKLELTDVDKLCDKKMLLEMKLVIQYYDNLTPIKILSYQNLYEELTILYQTYFVLSLLIDIFTHNDLNLSNVNVYSPFKKNEYIIMRYHKYDGSTIEFPTKHIVKIIDFGRSYYYVNKNDNSRAFAKNILGKIKKCHPADIGFMSTRKNKLYDLIHLYDENDIENKINEFIQSINAINIPLINVGKTQNVIDAFNIIENALILHNQLYSMQDLFGEIKIVGSLDVYSDGRPYNFKYLGDPYMRMNENGVTMPHTNVSLKMAVNMYCIDKARAIEIYGPIVTWDTSQVTNMSGLFYCYENNLNELYKEDQILYKEKRQFNEPIGSWDVSAVIDMSAMFCGAEAFNQPIGNWNVNSVVDMSIMFNRAKKFNQPMENWNTSSVITMSGMFIEAKSFNQPIGNWNTSNVNDIGAMFKSATEFNQPIEAWDMSKVERMLSVFEGSTNFNQPLENWDVSKAIFFSSMFKDAVNFNQPLNKWKTTNLVDTSNCFENAKSFNQPLNNWDMSQVIDVSKMFSGAVLFNQPIGNWDTSQVEDMSSLFKNAKKFNQSIENWDISRVKNMTDIFHGATAFKQDLSKWNIK